MLYPTTCVGLRYGPLRDVPSGFSWECAFRRCPIARGLSVLSRFGSRPGFAWAGRRLDASTRYSVSARACRSSVATSLPPGVSEF